MCYWKVTVQNHLFRDQLIQRPRNNKAADYIHNANLVANMLWLLTQVDPKRCFDEWGIDGKGIIKKATLQNGNELVIGDKAYAYILNLDTPLLGRRCFQRDYLQADGTAYGAEDYWVLGDAAESGCKLVIGTHPNERGVEFRDEVMAQCQNGTFFRPVPLNITFEKVEI